MLSTIISIAVGLGAVGTLTAVGVKAYKKYVLEGRYLFKAGQAVSKFGRKKFGVEVWEQEMEEKILGDSMKQFRDGFNADDAKK